ncbi:MAG TPA: 5-formyltetrahydrofolate cyclo-ligase, partial [Waddliaceae bacterium]
RLLWRENRQSISIKRRKESVLLAKKAFESFFDKHLFVLSYASFADEFDTCLINTDLCTKGKLVLPKIKKNNLHIFHIDNIEIQTKKNSWGIAEPIPHLCKKVNPANISLALIPGLAFDAVGNRLGYGKGFYDRFLPIISRAKIIGLGFKEQLMENYFIPICNHDFPLHQTLLF